GISFSLSLCPSAPFKPFLRTSAPFRSGCKGANFFSLSQKILNLFFLPFSPFSNPLMNYHASSFPRLRAAKVHAFSLSPNYL
ncbi:hypothetical protein, partial [Mucilaginibacter sp.]|uniref:hypothetical protein n=1 Tax=Mucilaginibacter sp. TaxID=1882438 RepID=UPI002ED43573